MIKQQQQTTSIIEKEIEKEPETMQYCVESRLKLLYKEMGIATPPESTHLTVAIELCNCILHDKLNSSVASRCLWSKVKDIFQGIGLPPHAMAEFTTVVDGVSVLHLFVFYMNSRRGLTCMQYTAEGVWSNTDLKGYTISGTPDEFSKPPVSWSMLDDSCREVYCKILKLIDESESCKIPFTIAGLFPPKLFAKFDSATRGIINNFLKNRLMPEYLCAYNAFETIEEIQKALEAKAKKNESKDTTRPDWNDVARKMDSGQCERYSAVWDLFDARVRVGYGNLVGFSSFDEPKQNPIGFRDNNYYIMVLILFYERDGKIFSISYERADLEGEDWISFGGEILLKGSEEKEEGPRWSSQDSTTKNIWKDRYRGEKFW